MEIDPSFSYCRNKIWCMDFLDSYRYCMIFAIDLPVKIWMNKWDCEAMDFMMSVSHSTSYPRVNAGHRNSVDTCVVLQGRPMICLVPCTCRASVLPSPISTTAMSEWSRVLCITVSSYRADGKSLAATRNPWFLSSEIFM